MKRLKIQLFMNKDKLFFLSFYIGSPYGIRTRVTALRGRRPEPLDERASLVADPGFEPGYPDSESGVLPLDESAQSHYLV